MNQQPVERRSAANLHLTILVDLGLKHGRKFGDQSAFALFSKHDIPRAVALRVCWNGTAPSAARQSRASGLLGTAACGQPALTHVAAIADAKSHSARLGDAVLVRRFQEGDTESYSRLASKYQGKLMRLIARIVPNRADAEEVVQEAMIRAYKALPEFRGDSAFYTWLFTITMNTALNFRKSEHRRANVAVASGGHDEDEQYHLHEAADIHTPVAELEHKQLLHALDATLDAMPQHLAAPLILCQIDGMSYDEIAAFIGCPTGTVRSRIFRARELIAARLKPWIDPQLPPRPPNKR